MSSGAEALKLSALAAFTVSDQFLIVRNAGMSSCFQLSEAYIADRRLPPCITFLPISLIADMSGRGPEAVPPVLDKALPEARSFE